MDPSAYVILSAIQSSIGGYEPLLPTLRIAPHDRHVAGCALIAGARFIITYNIRDFPPHLLTDETVEAWHPDQFLCAILHERPTDVRRVLAAQGASMHPPRTLAQVLARLAHDVPRFAVEAARAFAP